MKDNNTITIDVPADFVSKEKRYEDQPYRTIEIPLDQDHHLMAALNVDGALVKRDETPMTYADELAGKKPKLDYEVTLEKNKNYQVFQHDKNYMDFEGSCETITMNTDQIVDAFAGEKERQAAKEKEKGDWQIRAAESRFGDLMTSSDTDRQFDD